MAEEPQPAASEPAPQPKEVVVTEEAPPPPEEKAELTESAAAEAEEPKKEAPLAAEAEEKAMPQSVSFKEESNLVSDLADPEKKALDELKQLVAAALANRDFSLPPPPPPTAPAPAPAPAAAEDAPPPKPSETPDEPPKDDDAPKPPESEAPKPAEEAAAPEETAPAPAPAPEEKAVEVVAVDDDGAKTVEAIEETVVPAPAAPAPEAEEAAETKTEAAPPAPTAEAAEAEAEEEEEEVRIWGVPIVGDERSDAVLLKFLRARDYKPADAMAMLRGAVLWRKRFGIEALLGADLGLPEMDRVVFTRGADREGHPVCYNVYGEFQSRELYDKAFGDDDRRDRFLKWRIQYLERGIRSQLDFSPGGVCSMVQVTDLRNSPRLGKHRQVTRQALTLLQDNYPEFIAKKLFINVPWWYLAVNRMMSPFFTQRTKSKFVFAGPSKSAETLFKYIAPEQVPVQFGGLLKENDPDFTTADAVADTVLKPSSKQAIDIPVPENSTLVWEVRVLGWEVSYGAEFVPDAEDGYTVIVQKTRKLAASDEAVIKGTFKTGEAGKVVLIVDNPSSKKKKLLYRSKTRSSTEST